MKVRNGFVSNSSSSSFAIFGTILEYEEFKELMSKLNIKMGGGKYGDDYEDVQDVLNQITKGIGLLETHIDEECSVAIGRSYSTLGDNETGAEFKADAKSKVSAALGTNTLCETIITEWSC